MTRPPTPPAALAAGKDAPWPVTTVHHETWRRWFAGAPPVLAAIAALPDRLDHDLVVRRVGELLANGGAGGVAGAFATVLLWGYGSNGRGAYKTAQMLTGRVKPMGASLDAEAVDRLRQGVEIARGHGAIAAYDYLSGPGSVWKLGPAFFTKWLYFAAQGPDSDGAASPGDGAAAPGGGGAEPGGGGAEPVAPPMLDSVVTDWLAAQDPALRLDYAKARDYARYLDILESWGQSLGLASAAVGDRVFRLSRANR